MADTPSGHITGDWFDNCSCAVPCPCTFAQAPDNGFCESVLFWHVRDGHNGDIKLDGLSFVRAGLQATQEVHPAFCPPGLLNRCGVCMATPPT
jgi:hypothetical protein